MYERACSLASFPARACGCEPECGDTTVAVPERTADHRSVEEPALSSKIFFIRVRHGETSPYMFVQSPIPTSESEPGNKEETGTLPTSTSDGSGAIRSVINLDDMPELLDDNGKQRQVSMIGCQSQRSRTVEKGSLYPAS